MALQLSALSEELPRLYRELNGRIVDTMPLLVSGKDEKGNVVDIPRTPASFGYVLERRENAPKEVLGDWRNNYFFTGDGIATGVQGDMVSTWDSQLLRSLTLESKLTDDGALVLSTPQLQALKDQKEGTLYLTADEADQVDKRGYQRVEGVWTPENKVVGKVWDHLSRGRNLQTYAQLVNDTTNSDVVLNVYLNRTKKKSPTLRVWAADRIDKDAVASSHYFLGDSLGPLVGVEPEAHVAREKFLEARVTAALDAGQEFEFKGKLYVPVADSVASRLRR